MMRLRPFTDVRVLAGTVFLFSLLLYLPSVRNGFAYDDHSVIRLDDRVHDVANVGRFLTETYWRDPELGLYRPLTSISFMVDWAISDGNARWFHAVNVLWNAAAVALVFLLLASLAPPGAALAGALLFAAHPVHVEAVANVVGRAEVMAGLFSVAALLLWCRSAPGAEGESDRPGLRPPAVAALAGLYLLALMSKESAIMLPALIALCDMARGVLTPGSLLRWLRLYAIPLAVLFVIAVFYLVARSAVTGGIGPASVDPALDIATSTSARILTALQAWPHILRLLLMPRVLLSDYGPAIILPAFTFTPAATAGAVILIGLVGGGLWAWFAGRGRLAAVLLFVPAALLPTSNLLVPIGVLVAERTLYLPSLALALAAAFALDALVRSRASMQWAAAAVACVVVLFSVRTLIRIPEWRSTDAVFTALTRDRPDSFRAQWYHARVAVNDSMPLLALQRYSTMLRTWPYRRKAVLEAAAYAGQVGDLPYAEKVTAFAVQRWPTDLQFLRVRAGVQLDLGHTEAAAETVRRGLQVAPGDSLLRAMQQAISRGAAR